MAKQKYYVVWEGKTPGVYTSWPACQQQVNGVTGAKYKAFESKAEAEKSLCKWMERHMGKQRGQISRQWQQQGSISFSICL